MPAIRTQLDGLPGAVWSYQPKLSTPGVITSPLGTLPVGGGYVRTLRAVAIGSCVVPVALLVKQ
jgi:hypothetical protein